MLYTEYNSAQPAERLTANRGTVLSLANPWGFLEGGWVQSRKSKGIPHMRISWSEVVIILVILFFTSGLFRHAVLTAFRRMKETHEGFDEYSRRAGKTSEPKSSNTSQQFADHENKAFSSLEQEERDPYKILNVRHAASREEIISAYRKLAQLYHPDKVAGLAPEYLEIAERKMKMINGAYKKLME
jgi:hypothetical protein